MCSYEFMMSSAYIITTLPNVAMAMQVAKKDMHLVGDMHATIVVATTLLTAVLASGVAMRKFIRNRMQQG